MSPKTTKQLYLVIKGRQPGLYTQWFGPGAAAEQVKDFPNAVYKGFYTREAAVQWLQTLDRQTLAALPPSLRQLLKSGPSQPIDRAH